MKLFVGSFEIPECFFFLNKVGQQLGHERKKILIFTSGKKEKKRKKKKTPSLFDNNEQKNRTSFQSVFCNQIRSILAAKDLIYLARLKA
jgi:hypothetical protein